MNCNFEQSDPASGMKKRASFQWFWNFLKSVWFIVVIGVLVCALILAIEHSRPSEVGRKFIASLVYSAFIGIPSSFLLNWIGFRLADGFRRLTVLINVGALLTTATAGTFFGAAVLQVIGLTHHDQFRSEFESSYPIAIVITLILGLSITSFENLRHKLQAATIELRTREMEQERANKLLAEARLSSLESRIHPHFLFNTLNSIAALIPTDPQRAEDTVGKLASLLRFSLNANHSSLVPLSQELKIVRDYLQIESTRFGPRLRYKIAVPEALEVCKVPPLALQTLVENSVKHVAAQRSDGTQIQIGARAEAGRTCLEVIDDGPGFSLSAVAPEHGIGNLIARLELLFGDGGKLDVARENEKTVVRMSFPAES
jgi:two-component system, LytTR family, sensor histidine kinase AlgZ